MDQWRDSKNEQNKNSKIKNKNPHNKWIYK